MHTTRSFLTANLKLHLPHGNHAFFVLPPKFCVSPASERISPAVISRPSLQGLKEALHEKKAVSSVDCGACGAKVTLDRE